MSKYASKDLGACRTILGMSVHRDRPARMIQLDQGTHVLAMLASIGMSECVRRDTPEQVGMKLSSNDGPSAEEDSQVSAERTQAYQSIVGKLMYISLSTRPDIAHAVNQLSRFQSRPGVAHLDAAYHVVRYLRGCPSLPLMLGHAAASSHDQMHRRVDIESSYDQLGPMSIRVDAYADADWGGDVEDRKSTTGYVIRVNGSSISWQSKKQATVALSTAEAEYMAISMCLQEVKWIHQLLTEVGLRAEPSYIFELGSTVPDGVEHEVSSIIFTDNRAAESLCQSDATQHARTKHIDIRHHFIRDAMRSREVDVAWVEIGDQIADCLTKALDKQTFKKQREMILGECSSSESIASPSVSRGPPAAASAAQSSPRSM